MKTNYHTHTTRCMHATGDDEDYVLSAIKGGYRILGFSDHTPWKYRTDYVADMRMLPEELPGYVESLKTLREKSYLSCVRPWCPTNQNWQLSCN